MKTGTYREVRYSGLAGQEYCFEATKGNDNWWRLKIQNRDIRVVGKSSGRDECRMGKELPKKLRHKKKKLIEQVGMEREGVLRTRAQEKVSGTGIQGVGGTGEWTV